MDASDAGVYRTQARAQFAELVAQDDDRVDAQLGLATACIAAEEQPGVDAHLVAAELVSLARGLVLPDDADVFEKAARLVVHLFVQGGFEGDTEQPGHPRNSFLDQVIKRRRGLPILLSIVTMEVARQVGLRIDGIGFPGHFLVRPTAAEPPFYLDPFRKGVVVRQDELELRLAGMGEAAGADSSRAAADWLAPVSARQILVRVNLNLKYSYLHLRDARGALRAVERVLVLMPGTRVEARDRALLLGQLGRNQAAATQLQAYLAGADDGPEANHLRKHLSKLLQRAAEDRLGRGLDSSDETEN